MKSLIHQYIAMPVRSMVVAALQVESFILLTARLTVAERNQMIRSVMEWCQRFVNERKGGIVSYIDRGGFAIVFFSQEYSFHSILQLIEKLSHADPGVNHSNHVSLAINYINIYYHDPISLDQAADKAGVGASYLCRSFKEESCGLTEYVNKVRVRAAQQWIESGEYTMKENYERAGFSSCNYFFKVFKDTTGVTPHTYRKSMKLTGEG